MSSQSSTSEPGRVGPYRLLQRLGEGGMGVVHLGLDPDGKAVAIKVLRAHIATDPDARRRLAREVATLRRVRHPRVAAVLDADVDGDMPYLVTTFVPGKPLDAHVRDHGPLPRGHVARVGAVLAEALRAIHRSGVVHRDVKPANVMLLDGEPVLIDFGIAHVADESRITHTGLVMGTPGYLSPEIIGGDPVTAATDWWGWGATLAFAATGRPPFGSGPIEVVLDRVRRGASDIEGVDAGLKATLTAALSIDPTLRPAPDRLVAGLAAIAPPRAGTRPTGGGRAPGTGGVATTTTGGVAAISGVGAAAGAAAAAAGAGSRVGAVAAATGVAASAMDGIDREARTERMPPPVRGAASEAVTARTPPPSEAVTARTPPPSEAVTTWTPPPSEAVTARTPPPSEAVTSWVPAPGRPDSGVPGSADEAMTAIVPPPAAWGAAEVGQTRRFDPPRSPGAPLAAPPGAPAGAAAGPANGFSGRFAPHPPPPPRPPGAPLPNQGFGNQSFGGPGPGGPGSPGGPGQAVAARPGGAPGPSDSGYGHHDGQGSGQDQGHDETGQSGAKPWGNPTAGVVLGLLVMIAAVAAVAPYGAAWIAALGMVTARVIDRTSTALAIRRDRYGRRSSDGPMTLLALPWRLVRAAVTTVILLVLPILLGVSVAFIFASIVAGNATSAIPGTPLPLATGMIALLLTSWFGPGGGGVRRGTSRVVRSCVRGRRTQIAYWSLTVLLLFSALTVARNSDSGPDWGPLESTRIVQILSLG